MESASISASSYLEKASEVRGQVLPEEKLPMDLYIDEREEAICGWGLKEGRKPIDLSTDQISIEEMLVLQLEYITTALKNSSEDDSRYSTAEKVRDAIVMILKEGDNDDKTIQAGTGAVGGIYEIEGQRKQNIENVEKRKRFEEFRKTYEKRLSHAGKRMDEFFDVPVKDCTYRDISLYSGMINDGMRSVFLMQDFIRILDENLAEEYQNKSFESGLIRTIHNISNQLSRDFPEDADYFWQLHNQYCIAQNFYQDMLLARCEHIWRILNKENDFNEHNEDSNSDQKIKKNDDTYSVTYKRFISSMDHSKFDGLSESELWGILTGYVENYKFGNFLEYSNKKTSQTVSEITAGLDKHLKEMDIIRSAVLRKVKKVIPDEKERNPIVDAVLRKTKKVVLKDE